MVMKKFVHWSLLLLLSLLVASSALAAETKFEPVRAPSKGPADATVTIIEIADFM